VLILLTRLLRFVLKTREQRLEEKARMDKSPFKTLTFEDLFESERLKLTGTLTPVTSETFAKRKSERLDKKAAEAEAQKAKEATGKVMSESGDRKGSESEESDEEDEDDDRWNLEPMRRGTERLQEQKEQERLAEMDGESLPTVPGVGGSIDSVDGDGDGDGDGGGSGSAGSESNGEEASGESSKAAL
jgi:DRG Family Regulatory Proteins, Tma46